FFLAADDPESTPANGSRADGMAVIAADPSAQAKQAGGEALVAWVRYEGSFLVDDGTSKTTWLATTRFQDGRLKPWFAAEDKPSIRPALEHTAIYARRIGFSGPIDEKVRISPAGVGINVEPTIAVSPSGNTAVCVWVHDSFVDPQTGKQHVNLVDSNLGRELLYAVYDKATGEWSDAEPVLANPDAFPGLLEPHIAMSGDDDGLLAFTALRSDASTFDTGLVNGRHVFAVRLVDGEFGAPVLIHGKCLTPESGHWPTVAWSAPRNPVPIGGFFTDPPEFTIVYHGVGASGARAGAGNLLATTISAGAESFIAPIRLASDDAIHSNVSFAMAPTGEIRTLHMNGGFSEWEPGSIAGDPAARALQQKTTPIEPDAAITACRLSDSYPAPGSRITASIDVENLGLAATAREANGDSALGVVAIFIDAEGNERAVGEAPLGVLAPGETATVEIELEMPHDPVLLRVELSPNPIDRDPENDARECPFGTPAPTDVACSFAFYPTGEIDEETDAELTRGVARITWRNAAAYDEIWIYRDGSMLTALSGRATVFVDSFTSPGEHVYQVRARIGPSHSLRATCEVEIPADAPVVSGPTFRRGDVNGDGGFDISDPIAELAYLFAGGTTPGCLDAADANDDASVDISDAVYGLGYLFLGGPKPPAPFDECGEDPTDDAYECESYEACEGGF
ncbi:MAG TPA: hypothetical protein VK116_19955, partial [Planctomycetota bacterium]|nr:hypothetical protein [Planctomycetota bacterium]